MSNHETAELITIADSPAARAVADLVRENVQLKRQLATALSDNRELNRSLDDYEAMHDGCRHCGKSLPARKWIRTLEDLGVAFEMAAVLLWSCGYCSARCNEANATVSIAEVDSQ